MLLLLMQTFSKWALIFQYEVNKNYIAAVLCENRNKADIHCEGNCVLMKKMKASGEDNTPQNNQPAKIKIAEPVFVSIGTLPCLPAVFQQKKTLHSHYMLKKYSTPSRSIFHPPLQA